MKKKITIDPNQLAIECNKVAQEFKSLLVKGERPVSVILVLMPELRAYGKRKKPINYQYPLYRFFQAGKPDLFLLEKVKDAIDMLKEQRKKQ